MKRVLFALVFLGLFQPARPVKCQSQIGGCGYCVNVTYYQTYGDHWDYYNGCMVGNACYWWYEVWDNGSTFYTQGTCSRHWDANGTLIFAYGC